MLHVAQIPELTALPAPRHHGSYRRHRIYRPYWFYRPDRCFLVISCVVLSTASQKPLHCCCSSTTVQIAFESHGDDRHHDAPQSIRALQGSRESLASQELKASQVCLSPSHRVRSADTTRSAFASTCLCSRKWISAATSGGLVAITVLLTACCIYRGNRIHRRHWRNRPYWCAFVLLACCLDCPYRKTLHFRWSVCDLPYV